MINKISIHHFFNIFKPRYYKDICNCGHQRQDHGKLFLQLLPNSREKDWCLFYLKEKKNFCRCDTFKQNNLLILEDRYNKRSLWKKLLSI